MSKKIKKIILSTAVFLVSLLIFMIALHSLIDIKQIEKQAISSFERAFPNIIIEFDDLNYTLTSSLKIFGKNLSVKIKNRKTKSDIETLFTIKDFELKIPLWALIMNGGSLRFKGHYPEINFEEYNKGNNWKFSFLDQKIYKELDIISFITNSKLNFYLYNSKVNYRLRNEQPQETFIEKVVVKDLNSSSTTAYEVLTNITHTTSNNEQIKARLLAIGQINLKKYLENNIIETSLITNFSSIEYSKVANKIPDIKNHISFYMPKDSPAEFRLIFEFSQLLNLKANGTYSKEKIEMNDIDMNVMLSNLEEITTQKQKNKLKYFDFKNSEFKVTGSLSFNKIKDELTTNLEFMTNREFDITLPYSISFLNSIKGSWKNNQLEVSLLSNIFDGTIVSNLSTNLIYNTKKKSFTGADLYNSSILASGLKLSKVNFKDILYGQNEIDKSTNRGVNKRDAFLSGSVKLDFRQLYVNGNEINMDGIVNIKPYAINTEDIKFKIASGTGELSYQFFVDENNIKATELDVHFKDAPFDVIKVFLPSYFTNYQGWLDGQLTSKIIKDSSIANVVSEVDFELKDGEFNALDFGNYLSSFLKAQQVFHNEKDSGFKSMEDELSFDGKFSTMKLKAELDNGVAKIKSMELVSQKDDFQVNGKGKLYLDETDRDKQSNLELTLEYKKSQLSNLMKKNLGTNKLPVLLSGEGLELVFQKDYTIEKLINEVLREKSSQFINSKNLKDLLKEQKIKINPKLLKNF